MKPAPPVMRIMSQKRNDKIAIIGENLK